MPSSAAGLEATTTVAAVDVGTNAVLLYVVRQRGSSVEVVADEARLTRLGEGVDRTRQLAPGAMARTIAALGEYGRVARSLGAMHVAAVGTSALRDATNAEEFLHAAEDALGSPVLVIDGTREAALTFHGALRGLGLAPDAEVSVVDIGGGSTEIVTGRASGEPTHSASLDVGSVRLFERLGAAGSSDLATVAAAVDHALAASPPIRGQVVGISGTVTSLASLALGLPLDDPRVHGQVIKTDVLAGLVSALGAETLEQRIHRGLPRLRADVLPIGGTILIRVLHLGRCSEVRVSGGGVRVGLAQETLRAVSGLPNEVVSSKIRPD